MATKIKEKIVKSYVNIESGVVNGYQAIEKGVVGTYKKIETAAVNFGNSLIEEYDKQHKREDK
ncbi:MAG: hypothetical protein J6U95_00775 [Alistipes sp.]|jgi:hypothetical protein|nr:hypothetical protein [Alistipes sp.]MBQ6613237.1 hypothetical protein [Alistipes sp.]